MSSFPYGSRRLSINYYTLAALSLLVLAASPGLAAEQVAKLTPSDPEFSSSSFGQSVAIGANGLIVVGDANYGPWLNRIGAVFVFRRAKPGWVELAEIVPSDGGDGDLFGLSVATSGDRIFVGAPQRSIDWRGPGAVYVFRRDRRGTPEDPGDDLFVQEAKFVGAQGTFEGEGLGSSVAVDGNGFVAGTMVDEWTVGRARVYRRNGLTWTEEAVLVGSDTEAGDLFGAQVAIHNDLIAVGATRDNSVYVFKRKGTRWVEEAKLAVPDPPGGRLYGSAISIHGRLIAAGGADGSRWEAVHLFRGRSGGWEHVGVLTPASPHTGQKLGQAVAVIGNLVLVGAPEDNEGGSRAGAAFVFRRRGSDWLQVEKIIPTDTRESLYFGAAVAATRTHAVVGAAGAAYVFRLDNADSALKDSASFKDCFDPKNPVAPGCERFDLVPDGQINLEDYARLIQQYSRSE